MKIAIGNDHAGVEFKNKIMKELRSKGYEIINVGTDTLDSVDYPDIAKEVSKKISWKRENYKRNEGSFVWKSLWPTQKAELN